jgi:hypothetical protein
MEDNVAKYPPSQAHFVIKTDTFLTTWVISRRSRTPLHSSA